MRKGKKEEEKEEKKGEKAEDLCENRGMHRVCGCIPNGLYK